MQRNNGFTLVELIIAISILSLLMFSGSYVYSTLANRWDKELGTFGAHFDEMRAFVLLQDLLSGVMSYVVKDPDNVRGLPTQFFVGKEDSLLAVSRNGIMTQEYPEIFRLTVVKNKADKLDLVYQSVSTRDVLLLTTSQSLTFSHSFKLISNMDDITFNYLGADSLAAKTASSYEKGITIEQWQSDYSGLDKQLIPINIELTIRNDEKNIQMNLGLDVNSETLIQYYLTGITE